MPMKFANIPRTLWEHKKKSAFGLALTYLLSRKLYRWKRDCDIRMEFAQEARKYGDQPIAVNENPRRVTVLLDVASAASYEKFKTNALPLLNLAGLKVDLIRPRNRSELESIASEIDTAECDALYLIGGDGALCAVLSAIYRKRDQAAIPIGVFPIDSENKSLLGLAGDIFGLKDDVRPLCESAMALVENKLRPVYLTKVQLEKIDPEREEVSDVMQFYGFSDLRVGWFDRVETFKKKLWYWSGMKRAMAYLTSTIPLYFKQIPVLQTHMQWSDFCIGCKKCRPSVSNTNESSRRWWQYLTGLSKQDVEDTSLRRNYSTITNEQCGNLHEMTVKACDILIENVQNDDGCGLRVRTGGADRSPAQLLWDGWRRCLAKTLDTSPDPDFYQNDYMTNILIMLFTSLPEAVSSVSLFGNDICFGDDNKIRRITIESTRKYANLYIPDKLRLATV